MTPMTLDSLEPGDLLTIYGGPMLVQYYPVLDGVVTMKTEDKRLVGLPLKVIAVDLPFLVVDFVTCPQPCRRVLDSRDVILQRVSEAYVKALMTENTAAAQRPTTPVEAIMAAVNEAAAMQQGRNSGSQT